MFSDRGSASVRIRSGSWGYRQVAHHKSKEQIVNYRSPTLACIALSAGLALSPASIAQTPVDTSFTYQGKLSDAGSPASGAYDLQFSLFLDDAGTLVTGPVIELDDVTSPTVCSPRPWTLALSSTGSSGGSRSVSVPALRLIPTSSWCRFRRSPARRRH
jgi:hypothetical protein